MKQYLGCLLLVACSHGKAAVDPNVTSVPVTKAAIELDGEWEEADWDTRAAREVFKTNGVETRPFSEIRFLHDREHLFVTLYAADENVLSSDAFDLQIGRLAMRINPAGKSTPPTDSVRIATDLDGSLDDESNSDEEWVVELAVPLASLGDRNQLTVHTARCDTPHGSEPRCGAWDGAIALE